jgi:hypothetical protein
MLPAAQEEITEKMIVEMKVAINSTRSSAVRGC